MTAIISRGAFPFAPKPTADDPELFRCVAGAPDAAVELAREFDALARAQADGDENLSEKGRAKKRRELARGVAADISRMQQMLDHAARAIGAEAAEVKKAIDAATTPDAAEAALAVETRNVLRNMSDERRRQVVLDAIKNRNTTLLRAIVGALPEASGLVNAKGGLHAMARDALVAAAVQPDALARLDRHRRMLDAGRRGLDTLRAFVDRRIGKTD